MKTVTKTALANARQNRTRNMISGAAIILTTLLIFMVLTVGYASVKVRFAAVNAYYPPYHAMFRQVSEEDAGKLKSHNDMEEVGLRSDLGEGVDDDSTILFLWMDAQALELNKVELAEGAFPKAGNEIALPEGLLAEYGITAGIGDTVTLPLQLYEDGGLGYQKEDTFRISGFLKGEIDEENKAYSVLVSRDCLEQSVPAKDREYRVMFRLQDVGENVATTDAIEERVREIGADFGVSEDNVVINTDYLMANYTDPAALFAVVCIILVVMAAGVLTIYSIHYVSMIPKVQEYGKLKAMGATRRQIRQIVFREGLLVTALSLPLGLLLGSLLAGPVIRWIYRISGEGVQTNAAAMEMNRICMELLEQRQVPVLYGWVYILTILTVLVTVYLSLVKPMRMAAKISPVEAMRYQGEIREKKKERKGFAEMSLVKLTRSNLSRNKKRSILTIVTLGAVGILFMAVATVLSCADPEEIAKQEFEGDYEIAVDSWEGDKMNPDRAWVNLMQNNPLNGELLEQIRAVDGVEEVKVKTYLTGTLADLDPEREIASASIQGLDESYREIVENCQIEGAVTWEELEEGEKILVSDHMLRWFPELKLGDAVRMELETPEGTVERTFEIAAVGEYPSAVSGSNFLLPDSVLAKITGADLSDICVIRLEEGIGQTGRQEAYTKLENLAKASPYLTTDSFEKHVETWETAVTVMTVLGYAFLLILGAVGVMNLINTMVNSIYTRRRELGIIQAIGMSEKQLVRMLQLEGLFYTAGTLLVALGMGSLAGYGIFLYAKAENMMNITVYHYPGIQAAVLAVAVAALQMILTCGGGGAADDPDLRRVPELPQDEPDRPDPVRGVKNGSPIVLYAGKDSWSPGPYLWYDKIYQTAGGKNHGTYCQQISGTKGSALQIYESPFKRPGGKLSPCDCEPGERLGPGKTRLHRDPGGKGRVRNRGFKGRGDPGGGCPPVPRAHRLRQRFAFRDCPAAA